MRVGVVQMNTAVRSIVARLEEMETQARAAAQAGAKLVVFPEMTVHGYTLDWRNMRAAETVPGATSGALVAMARSLDVIIVTGFGERSGAHLYNTLLVVGPSGLLGKYRKINVSSAERARWHPGSEPVVVETPLGRIGLGICADMLWTHPWTAYRGKVDLVAIGSCWPDWFRTTPSLIRGSPRRTHQNAVRTQPERISRALGVPVLFANACGDLDSPVPVIGGRLRGFFAAGSRIVNRGETIIDDRGEGRPEIIVGEVELCAGEPDVTRFNSWIGSLADRAQLQGLDRLTSWISAPAYAFRRRQAFGRAAV
jgi:N-carbamoylputrescine amidase